MTSKSPFDKAAVTDIQIDIEGLLVSVGALKPNDQRLTKSDRDEDPAYSTIRSGKMFTTSANPDDAEYSD